MSQFEFLEDEEEILSFRKHWLFLFWAIFWLFLGLVGVFLVLMWLGFSVYFTVAFFCWLVLLGGYFLRELYLWAKSEVIFTNQRVIVVNQEGIFVKKTSEVKLEDIVFVNSQIKGVLASAFGFGDLKIQPVGFGESILVEFVPEVIEKQKILVDLVSRKRGIKPEEVLTKKEEVLKTTPEIKEKE